MELADAEPKGDLSRWDTKKAAAISSSQSVFRFPGTPVVVADAHPMQQKNVKKVQALC